MAFFSFAEGSAMFDTTPIENLFLMEHLPTAPEACLRVYLYARMLALHPELGGDMAETARALHMDEDAVYEAFAYWERQGLVRRLTDRPPTYELLPVRAEGADFCNPMERDYYLYKDFHASIQSLFAPKMVEPHELQIAKDWLNIYGYDQDAVLRLVKYGIETTRSRDTVPNPKGVFKRMDEKAEKWAERGCKTLEDVERVISEQEKAYPIAKAVLKRFGITKRNPSMDEMECARRWVDEWNLTEEKIIEACEETIKTTHPSFDYLNSILRSRVDGSSVYWKELSEVLRELDPYQAVPTPDQLQTYIELRGKKFEAGTIKLAAIQCKKSKKTRLDDVKEMLDKWGKEGIFTLKDAEAFVEELTQKTIPVRALLEKCGLERRPTKNDLALYERWKDEHDAAVIDFAAECARGMQVPMKYMDKLLNAWRDEGVRTAEDAKAHYEAVRLSRAAANAPGAAANPALNYAQREYKDEDFGDDFYVDLDKYGKGGDGK